MRLETRGPEFGVCNICGTSARLTEDHIPPKGVPLVGQAYLQRLSDTLGAERQRTLAGTAVSGRHFQRGVKYRSICSRCNNELLGAAYDPTLIAFCTSLHGGLAGQVHVPITLRVKVNRLVRALVGHILSHGIGQHGRGEIQSMLSDYVLDPGRAFSPSLRAYCWVYPYKAQIVAHGLGRIFDFRSIGRPPFVCSVIKFFPIGFMCSTADLPEGELRQVTRLDHLTTPAVDAEVDVILNISSIPNARWPEAPGDRGAVFHNDLGTIATPIPPKK